MHTVSLQGIVKIRDSKFGVAMVVETTKESGSYVLGFRIDPYEKMKDIVQEIHSLYHVYHTSPTFGVDFELEDQVKVDIYHIARNIGGIKFGSWAQNHYFKNIGRFKFGGSVRDRHSYICE